eukprot:gene10411-13986_t
MLKQIFQKYNDNAGNIKGKLKVNPIKKNIPFVKTILEAITEEELVDSLSEVDSEMSVASIEDDNNLIDTVAAKVSQDSDINTHIFCDDNQDRIITDPDTISETNKKRKTLFDAFWMTNKIQKHSSADKSEGQLSSQIFSHQHPKEKEILHEDIPQAFSHFSYVRTKRQELVCDLQGEYCPDSGNYTFTDPCIHCHQRETGRSNRGWDGINNFFISHKCSALCKILGL